MLRRCRASLLFLTPILLTQPLGGQSTDVAASDFDGSGIVDFSDFLEFAAAFGKKAGDEGYDSKYDLDGSNAVDFGDFLIFARNFGVSTNPVSQTLLYLADFVSDRVEVIDIETNLTIPSRSFDVSFPRGLAVEPSSGQVYVVSPDSLLVFSDRGQLLFGIPLTPVDNPDAPVPQSANGFKTVLSSDGARAYVTETTSSSVEAFDLNLRQSLGVIPVGVNPASMAFSSDGGELYVGHFGSSLTVIDIASLTVTDTIGIGSGSLASNRLERSPDGSILYTARSRPDASTASGVITEVIGIDPAARILVDSLQIGSAEDLVVSVIDLDVSVDGTLYVSFQTTAPGPGQDFTSFVLAGRLLAIDVQTFSIANSVTIGETIGGFGIGPEGNKAYVSGIESLLEDPTLRVFVVDLDQWQKTGTLPVTVDSASEFDFRRTKPAPDLLQGGSLAFLVGP